MTYTTWHAPDDLLARFASDPASIDDAVASSLEAHLIACHHCRAGLSRASAPSLAPSSWDRLAGIVDQPRTGLIERLLIRIGVDDGLARLLTATSALQMAGFAAIVVVTTAAAITSRVAEAEGPFLVLAPLAPLAAVAATFAPAADPGGEAAVASPLHGFGLVIRRASAVLATTFAILGVASLALPDLGPIAAAWVLPALAVALGALALSTWLRVEVAVAGLALAWLTGIWTLWWADGRTGSVTDLAPFTTVGQAAALAVAVVAAAGVVVRRDRFATLEAF